MLAQKNSILHRKPKDLIVGPTASCVETEYAKEQARDAARAKRKADLVRAGQKKKKRMQGKNLSQKI